MEQPEDLQDEIIDGLVGANEEEEDGKSNVLLDDLGYLTHHRQLRMQELVL